MEWGDIDLDTLSAGADATTRTAIDAYSRATGDRAGTHAASQCSDTAMSFVSGAAATASGLVMLVASGYTGAGAVAGGSMALSGAQQATKTVHNYLKNGGGKQPWADYLMGHAVAGTLLASVGRPGEWYRVTHNKCGGGRNTTSGAAYDLALKVGAALGEPGIVQKNGLTTQKLVELFAKLRAAGNDGLDPIERGILSGFRNATGDIPKFAKPIMARDYLRLSKAIPQAFVEPPKSAAAKPAGPVTRGPAAPEDLGGRVSNGFGTLVVVGLLALLLG